jgi:hypothetical protein
MARKLWRFAQSLRFIVSAEKNRLPKQRRANRKAGRKDVMEKRAKRHVNGAVAYCGSHLDHSFTQAEKSYGRKKSFRERPRPEC